MVMHQPCFSHKRRALHKWHLEVQLSSGGSGGSGCSTISGTKPSRQLRTLRPSIIEGYP